MINFFFKFIFYENKIEKIVKRFMINNDLKFYSSECHGFTEKKVLLDIRWLDIYPSRTM